MVNFDKSALNFSPSTPSHPIEDIVDVLNVPMVHGHDIYLGSPTLSLRSKKLQFGYLRERVQQKLHGWSCRLFSTRGREVLIKSILQAIPSYAMSCFKIPVAICKEVEQICANFLVERCKW